MGQSLEWKKEPRREEHGLNLVAEMTVREEDGGAGMELQIRRSYHIVAGLPEFWSNRSLQVKEGGGVKEGG
ncbi:hypothetical protein L6452_43833 [Arctium lappa]|uniref:Uncharacterized protein n=1 Tax=Arctium lappa TaxID=4217 RepID=A0ACB8XDZ5_ARCLA|nr:hypothetical protein L6452_43833 [Arctium lappa]